jgi:hypothetical protein
MLWPWYGSRGPNVAAIFVGVYFKHLGLGGCKFYRRAMIFQDSHGNPDLSIPATGVRRRPVLASLSTDLDPKGLVLYLRLKYLINFLLSFLYRSSP